MFTELCSKDIFIDTMKTNLSSYQSFQKRNAFSRWQFVAADRPTVSHTFLLPLTQCKSVFVLVCPLKLLGKQNWNSGGWQCWEVAIPSSTRTLVSQASRSKFMLHCIVVILQNANLKSEIILVVAVVVVVVVVQYVMIQGKHRGFSVGARPSRQEQALCVG